jgi:predicted nucleic acid-binding protein
VRHRSTIAVIDAGPLYAAIDVNDPDHRRAADVLTRAEYRFVVPVLVVAEVVHFIGERLDPSIEAAFIEGLGDLAIESPNDEDWARIAQLLRQYHDFPLGTVDASVVALAERLHTDLIVTLDERHFRAIRPRHVGSFRLLPE